MAKGAAIGIAAFYLCAVAPASASYTIGAPVDPPSGTGVGSLGPATTHFVETAPGLNSPAPSGGVIVQFKSRWLATDTGAYAYRVMHATGGGSYRALSSVFFRQPAPNSLQTTAARVPVAQGDTIGVDHPRYATDSNIQNRVHAGQSYNSLSPPPADGATGGQQGTQSGLELLLNAVVEPDADGDGYGDESQDFCLGNAAVQISCPADVPVSVIQAIQNVTSPAPKAAGGTYTVSSKGAVSLPVSCSAAAPAPCAGSAGIEARGAVLARASRAATFSVPPGQTVPVSVALSKSGLKLLAKKKKLSARVIITSDGQQYTSTVTLKAPKAKRKKKKT